MNNFFIGIDVSKETIDVSCHNPSRFKEAEYVGQYTNRPSGYRSMVRDLRLYCGGISTGQWLFCCETTGSYDKPLCNWICGKGMFIWRESALQIKLSKGICRGKDDKTDSMMITDYARRHHDKAVRYEQPSPILSALKELYSHRRSLVEMRTMAQSRLSAMKFNKDNLVARFITKDIEKEIKLLNERISICERKIIELIESDEEIMNNYHHIISIKGVGPVCATALIIYSGNFNNIPTANKMACYSGCASFRDQSGTSIDKGAFIKHLSRTHLKSVLSMAALQATRTCELYTNYAKRMKSQGKSNKVIINNVRNKLIHLVYALVRNDCDFDEKHVFTHHKL